MNFRIQVLETDGTFVRTFGSLGDAPGRFSKPKGIAVDAEGRIVVVEGLHDAVQFFDPEGRLLLSVGSPGSDPGHFWLPAGLAVDRTNQLLFVADSYNSRVQVFRILEEPASGLLSQESGDATEGRASP
jgi:sugar lactone lactonase YvrE